VLIGAVGIRRSWIRRAIVWSLVYLWSAAGALAISHASGWQYDGGLGWWLAVGYSLPALALAAPLATLTGSADVGQTYSMIALGALTVASLVLVRRPT